MSSSETKAACPSRVVRGDCIWMLPAHLRCMQCLLFPQPYTALAKAYLRQTYWHGDVLFSGPYCCRNQKVKKLWDISCQLQHAWRALFNKKKNKKAPKQGGKAVSKTQADVSAGCLALFVFMLSTSMHARSVLHLTRACANKVSFEGALAWSTF